MIHFTNMPIRGLFSVIIYLTAFCTTASAQDCQPDYILNPVTANNTIEWSKFPEFTLPFKIIYNATRFGDTQSQPLKHGFSHIASFSGPEPGSLNVAKRALIWYGVATSSGDQPWADNALRSPWGNDTAAYRSYWDNYSQTAKGYDIICLDIERMQREDRDILALKGNAKIPQIYRNLSDADFVATYKRDMRWWYTEAINRLRMKGITVPISSYSDVPVRNSWLNVTSNSWQDWITNSARTHYLVQGNDGKIGGSFYNAMDYLTPSPYYYYGYDHPIGKDYLSYLLFNIEANRAWSDKPIIPFVWMRVHDSYDSNTPFIAPFVAEATAIFPFFSGAKGLWLWENPFFPGTRQENYTAYERFIYGLYRLSGFKDMFEGDYSLVIPQSARDNMELQNPIWRGVVKGSNILIAAQNPYAADNAETYVFVSHQKWSKSIKLKGKEVFLCKFDLNDIVNSTEPHLSDVFVYSNPVDFEMKVMLNGVNGATDVDFALINTKGQTVLQKQLKSNAGQTQETIALPRLAAGMYFARFATDKRTITKKVVINQ
ncbi:T9SS type A sorting domain-containing protein [Dyadobacter sp. CY326]|uniref:T9SS type A sorting domain-containing protein n=1 Tax=Dyadobacter sp. CY326 TaxID=2907300 RepID=UPI001F28AEEF|nr:T9SS type A sorting domain-containing protein [Dyadobacter sp. CY326]MCE7064107.1 T9SS type A sorting domain-containing protein [Dyadobacter sp. CY326]